jgi:hypothetical protein
MFELKRREEGEVADYSVHTRPKHSPPLFIQNLKRNPDSCKPVPPPSPPPPPGMSHRNLKTLALPHRKYNEKDLLSGVRIGWHMYTNDFP